MGLPHCFGDSEQAGAFTFQNFSIPRDIHSSGDVYLLTMPLSSHIMTQSVLVSYFLMKALAYHGRPKSD